MTKEEKAEYDRQYRAKNREIIKQKKQAYCESPAGRAMQKRNRVKLREYHNEYTRRPDQREKEKIRRHVREGKLGEKLCIVCGDFKPIISFEHWSICEDGRSYICRSCEKEHQNQFGCSTRGVVTAMVMRKYSNLNRRDVVKYPYLVEANKFLILLKQITK